MEKVHPSGDLVVQKRFVRVAKADLVDRVNVILGGQRADAPQPDFFDRAQPVQQDHHRPLTGLEVVNVLAENGSHFFRRRGGLILREGEGHGGQQCRGKHDRAEMKPHRLPHWN